MAVNQDLAAERLVELQQEVTQRALARAASPNDEAKFAGLEVKRRFLKNYFGGI